MKRLAALFLAIVMPCSLAACGSETSNQESKPIIENTGISTEANGAVLPESEYDRGALPGDEYERGIWYGFMPDDLAGADSGKVVTWKQYCTMLGNMIQRYDSEAYSEWQKITADMPETTMKRDGAMIALLFAGKVTGMDDFNIWCWPSECDWGSQCSWDYPLDWNQPIMLMGEEDANYMGSAFLYSFGFRASSVSGSFLMDMIDGNPSLNKDFTLDMAIRSVVRLYESDEDIAYEYACAMLEQVKKTPEGQKIIADAEARKEAILTSETNIGKSDTFIQGETYTGTAYYVSNNGNDNADGKSPETAWATLDRLGSVNFQFGDVIFFERGSIWREAMLTENIRNTEGITLSAYGTGEKPRFYGSPENGVGTEKWELYYEGDNGEKVWKFHRDMADTSVIVMNGGEVYAKRDLAYWNGEKYLQEEDFTKDYIVEQELKDMEFFTEIIYNTIPFNADIIYYDDFVDGKSTMLEGDLYLRCDAGNPGEVFKSIEFSTAHPFGDGLSDYMTLDNLNVSYCRPIVAGTSNEGDSTDYWCVQNCEMGWGGGYICYYTDENDPYGADMGYYWMDGGFPNCNGSGNRIRNNYLHHAFQEGLTLETFADDNDPCNDSIMEGNLTEYCLMGMLLINWDNEIKEPHIFSNIYFRDNMVLYSGFEHFYNAHPVETTVREWHGTRGLRVIDTHALAFSEQVNAHDGTVLISDNLFAFSASQLVLNGGITEEYSDILDGNTYAQLPGMVWLAWMTYPHYDAQYYEYVCDPEEAIIKIMRDENATIISFD